ncbi:MAG TPA: hypothetical protein VK666_20045 [Chryseolinea sp.]|nr:hypothetical protein [Chryseolinea sp.]
MDLISGFFLWVAEVAGVKWVRAENNRWIKVAKALVFFTLGIIATMLFFVVFG